jgi:L-ascorbate metabolism protein UlaG (beta-lactamase superfamily)
VSWRRIANWAKHRPFTLHLADRLGRSRGRLAVLDRLNPPPRAPWRPDFREWERHELAAAWIGHATIVMRLAGMTILTDPVFSCRIGVGLGVLTAGPKRLVEPAVKLTDLPPIDLILISHAHFDHLDRPTLARLPKRTPVVTAVRTRDLLTDLGFRHVHELAWDRRLTLGTPERPLAITALEPDHWGARTFHDMQRSYNAYLLRDVATDRKMLFGGDTAFTHAFDRHGPVDLAMLGIGAYDPYVAAHATPEQAWAMAQAIPARRLLPFHHSTFKLSFEPTGEPIERLIAAAGNQADQVVVRQVGGMWVGR